MPPIIPNEIEDLREDINDFIESKMELEDIILHYE